MLRRAGVVDADHRLPARRDQPLLDGGVVLERAVPVDVVGREVEERAHLRPSSPVQDRSGRTNTPPPRCRPPDRDRAPAGRCCRPPARASPSSTRRCPSSAVVVDLPFVPVIAASRNSGSRARRSASKSSMSPITGMPAACARSTVQCGLGWVSGTPGDSTSASNAEKSATRRSPVGRPARSPRPPLALVVVAHDLSAAGGQRMAVARPDPPRPKTATRFPDML